SCDLYLERSTSPPGDSDRRYEQAGVEQQRVVGSPWQAHSDAVRGDVDLRVGVEEAGEDLARLDVLEAVQVLAEHAVEAGGDDGEGHVEVDLHGDRRRQGVDVKEV